MEKSNNPAIKHECPRGEHRERSTQSRYQLILYVALALYQMSQTFPITTSKNRIKSITSIQVDIFESIFMSLPNIWILIRPLADFKVTPFI